MRGPVPGADSPLYRDRLGTPWLGKRSAWEGPKAPGGQSAGHEPLALLKAECFQINKQTNKTWTGWFVSSRGHQDDWGLEYMKSGRGDEMAAGGRHSSLPTPVEVSGKTVAINWKKRTSNWVWAKYFSVWGELNVQQVTQRCCEVSVLGGFQNLTGQEPQAIWTGFRVDPPSEQEVRLETSRVVCVMLDSTFERNRDTQRL